MINYTIKRLFSTNPARGNLIKIIQEQINEIKQAGTYKNERIITSSQSSQIKSEGKEVLNFCANNYLGLSNNQQLIDAAKQTLDTHGFGLSSVRFICGTQDLHKQLEAAISKFHGTEDTILFPSNFDANAGFFEAILDNRDAIISDSLNHASIIDGVRLSKAQRFRYDHLNMKDLEEKLKEAQNARVRFIVTDGVFSMDGDFAPLPQIVDLARKYKANIFVDDAHATGFIGKTGRGSGEYWGVQDEIDVVNSTLGKALGGGTGGYTTSKKEIVEILRQKARPYLFSNSIAPPIVGACLKVFEILSTNSELRDRLHNNTKLFRERIKKAGFRILGHDDCPIAPIWLGDARLASNMADEMMKESIYVIGFSYPVVPKGEARIRVQLSAAHTTEHVNKAVDAFIKIGKKLQIIN